MTISKDLFLALLSLDAYNRGYGAGIDGLGGGGSKIGTATVGSDELLPDGAQAAGFYAVSYDTPYGTVISYRGTDNFTYDDVRGASDITKGWTIGAGLTGENPWGIAAQSGLTIDFYDAVVGDDEPYDLYGQKPIVTGHSLGGGLAGL